MSARLRVFARNLARRVPVGRRGPQDPADIEQTLRELRDEVRSLRKLVYSKELAKSHLKETRGQLKVVRGELRRHREILKFVVDDEPGNRRRLWDLRASPDYEPAYSEAEPLVTVIIPTYSKVEALTSVAVPSLLAQTYRNLEILVIGDGEPPGTAEALAQFRDPRIVYFNRERRGPYPEDPEPFRYVKAGPPFNEGLRRANGRWLSVASDDDAYRPEAIETLVAAAREHRYEYCYGKYARVTADGKEAVRNTWPPTLRLSVIATIYHAGLRFLEFEFANEALGRSWDKSLLRRMLHAGVRFGMVDQVLADFDPVHHGVGGYRRDREHWRDDERS